jgi:integrase
LSVSGAASRRWARAWRGELSGAALHGVETYEASRRSRTERLLYTFSKAFLTDPSGGLPLDKETRKVYALLQNQVEQFRKLRGEMAMKDYELAKISLAELLQPAVERLAQEEPEKLAKALTPEQIMRMLEALPPEVREQIKQRLH